ncbi:MAG: glycosyltransferase [Planctomycetota bacterium]
MKRPKVSLMVVSTTLSTGGAQRFTSNLLHCLDRESFEPSLALLRPEIEYPLPNDVRVHHLGYRGARSFVSTAGRLRRLVEREMPVVVLSNITATNLISGLALRFARHRPRWVARAGSNARMHDGHLRRLLAAWLYRRVDLLVANSQGLATELASCSTVRQNRIAVIGNLTDVQRIERLAAEPGEFSYHGDAPLLVAVGRLDRQKRYDVMLEAFARVRQATDAHLWICGEGPERDRMRAQITRLNLQENVELLGFCNNPYALMHRADLFVMCSDHEGLPNALIEAQCLGLPAVSTNCPHGPSEIIVEGETGLLVPVRDPRAMAQGIVSLLEARDVLKTSRDRIRVSARGRFSDVAIRRKWEEVLTDRTLSGLGGSPHTVTTDRAT